MNVCSLKRAFGYYEVPLLDPFLLLDDFRSNNPEHYIAGFPWHPHRGIETVTYMLEGTVEHGDSMGNKGVIRPGEVQWMTAGSGIIHQEMPKGINGRMGGFQLWVNLPSSHKMMEPRYREVKNEQIQEVSIDKGIKNVKIAANDRELRFLLISGKPMGEPVAWGGPIVMNTQEELQIAFDEYRNGTFIKHKI